MEVPLSTLLVTIQKSPLHVLTTGGEAAVLPLYVYLDVDTANDWQALGGSGVRQFFRSHVAPFWSYTANDFLGTSFVVHFAGWTNPFLVLSSGLGTFFADANDIFSLFRGYDSPGVLSDDGFSYDEAAGFGAGSGTRPAFFTAAP